MEEKGRRIGIDVVGEVPWGTHSCLFYQTREELVDFLVPYLKAGLENNELCMWVTSKPLKIEDARISLREAVRDLDDYIKRGQMEILDASQWYTRSGKLRPKRILQDWIGKVDQAIESGFEGLRVTGDTYWLKREGWEKFADYETMINKTISNYPVITLCSYSLDRCGVSEVIDVISNHQFGLIKRGDMWEPIESFEHKQLKEALQISHSFLEIANRHTKMAPLLDKFVAKIQSITGCDAVGIRILDKEGNIPYTAYIGYSQEFYESENPLSIRSDQCMCTNVIKGKADPNLPFYTEGGSFYTNSTIRLLSTVPEEGKGQTCGICNQFGYESVALIPIRLGDRILGLFHVADPRKNMVPLETIVMLEKAAMQLGMAIKRVQATEALEAEEERLSVTLRSVADGVIATDTEGRIVLISKTAETLTGWTAEEAVGKPLREVFHIIDEDTWSRAAECSREPCGDPVEEALKTDGMVSLAERNILIARDGTERIIADSGSPVRDRNSNTIGVVLVFRDITETRRMEKELLRAQKHESLGVLAGGIAHDLNNILAVILGNISLARMYTDPEKVSERLIEADRASMQAKELTQQLLTFSRGGAPVRR